MSINLHIITIFTAPATSMRGKTISFAALGKFVTVSPTLNLNRCNLLQSHKKADVKSGVQINTIGVVQHDGANKLNFTLHTLKQKLLLTASTHYKR